MLSSILALLAASAAVQADPTVQPRERYMRCLDGLVRQRLEQGQSPAEFEQSYGQACTAERAAYRQAIVRRESGYGATPARAAEDADLEMEDARANFVELYNWHHSEGTRPD